MTVMLPPKVSGFHNPGEAPPEPLGQGLLHEELAGVRQQARRWRWADYSQQPNWSYHAGLWLWEDEPLLLLVNKYYRLAACSRVDDRQAWEAWQPGQPLPRNQYIDFPALREWLPESWVLLPQAFLLQAVDADQAESQAAVAQLQLQEFAEFSYWEPRNMGNIVFNNWQKR
jgi:hypothetical protein